MKNCGTTPKTTELSFTMEKIWYYEKKLWYFSQLLLIKSLGGVEWIMAREQEG